MKMYGYVVRDKDTGKCFNGNKGDMSDRSLWVFDIPDAFPFFEDGARKAYDIALECGIKAELVYVAVDATITENRKQNRRITFPLHMQR